jgi:hypothetical protein
VCAFLEREMRCMESEKEWSVVGVLITPGSGKGGIHVLEPGNSHPNTPM